MREFIAALEKNWTETEQVPPDSPKGKKLAWMKQQADRLDPLTPSPPSILDRKNEIAYW